MIIKFSTKISCKLCVPLTAIFSFLFVASTSAVELMSGITYFDSPPRFLEAATSQHGTYIWGATYYFTVKIPKDAGEPLQKLEIKLQDSPGRLSFKGSRIEAFEGKRRKPGERLSLKDVMINPNTQIMSAIFDPPVSPGKTVTLRISPVRNPNTGGTYLYGITAFPSGIQPASQFLGFGRIRIYDRE